MVTPRKHFHYINLYDIARILQRRFPYITERDAQLAIKLIMGGVAAKLQRRGVASIYGFGVFKVVNLPSPFVPGGRVKTVSFYPGRYVKRDIAAGAEEAPNAELSR